MAPIELLLPNALSVSSEALSVQKPPPLTPQLEALNSSIQTPNKAGTHFTDPEGMEGWVDPLLCWVLNQRPPERGKKVRRLRPLGQRSNI